MPNVHDPAEAMQARGLSVFAKSLGIAPLSETKFLYLRAKRYRGTAARGKRPYIGLRHHYGDEARDFPKTLAKTHFVKASFVEGSEREIYEEGPLSLRQLLRKLKSELSPNTFEELRQVIRTEDVAEMVARTSKSRTDNSFIIRATELDARGHTDAALDLIYDSVDKLMRDGQFPTLDSILSGVPVAELTVDILLGLLTATLPARNRLHSRNPLFRQIEQTLKNRGQLEPGLLTGLE